MDYQDRTGRWRRGGPGGFTWGQRSHRGFEPAASLVPAPPLGEIISTIPYEDLAPTSTGKGEVVTIAGTKLVASYNWMNGESPTIMIPGKPPRWTPPQDSQQLHEDSGTYYRDRNAANFPEHPMEPAIVSVMKMAAVPMPVDLFACNSSLGNLLRYSNGQDNAFRMLVEVVGNAVHLIRRENSPMEQIPGVQGYGHAFPEAYTTWEPDVKGSKTHNRILKYRFGGIDIMLRFEGDGYLPSGNSSHLRVDLAQRPTEADLLSTLERMTTQQSMAAAKPGKLKIKDGGSMVDQDVTFDLKTRSVLFSKQRDTVGEELPRLWIAQINKFILAHHKKGRFEEVKIMDVGGKVREWEEQNQAPLKRLKCLLRGIIDVALGEEGTKLEIFRQKGRSLQIRKRLPDAGDAFSESARHQWEAWLSKAREDVTLKDTEKYSSLPLDLKRHSGTGDCDLADDNSDGDESGDLTACDLECGYCGKCR